MEFGCREKWELGAREDWRYAEMRARYGSLWPLASFCLVYLIQQGMLVGLTLPLYAVFSSRSAWQPVLDSLATAGCLVGEKGNPQLSPPSRRAWQPVMNVTGDRGLPCR